MIHTGILEFRKSRYFWWASILVIICLVIYLTQDSSTPPNGGTWQGYTTGTIGALLILWLSLLGIRKRRYKSRIGSVAGWTSAHVYLGAAVAIIGTLHSAGQLGWNIHTLPYVLMIIVVLSGFFGLYYYIALPQKALRNRSGLSRDQLFAELFELDEQGKEVATKCSADISLAASTAIERTGIGGGVLAQLLRSDNSKMKIVDGGAQKLVENKDQARVLEIIANQIPSAEKRSEVEPLRELLSIMSRRQAVIRRIVRDIQLQGILRIWLYIHIPITIALLVSLVTHIVATFLYW